MTTTSLTPFPHTRCCNVSAHLQLISSMVAPEHDLCDLVADGVTSLHEPWVVLDEVQPPRAVDELIVAAGGKKVQ